eukprot:CAMPEP_0173406890 /NCGR_PEP_ID=MMETSP1356-20130122/65810_1 /TAXON_ID=77927 ORGANISM="Hemiselmis virescens, Strain PCC157" /NCGR_SAMPLE_ID=MMETSP1356 /ASSEMBLY_ACC=CAM_ASM_000847 /LENGTH=116 /DNA_ID=CAMNT_0014367967 /DNA_START=117 /DNA_END=467 /DNA_ORIENTATION=-
MGPSLLWTVHMYQACILHGIDALNPYLTRCVPLHKVRGFADRHRFKIVPFSLPFLLLSMVPVFGQLVSLLVTVSASPLLLILLIEEEDLSLSQSQQGTGADGGGGEESKMFGNHDI